jgi:hypothetical protein
MTETKCAFSDYFVSIIRVFLNSNLFRMSIFVFRVLRRCFGTRSALPLQFAKQLKRALVHLVAVFCIAHGVCGHCQTVSDQSAIEDGRDALRGYRSFPWYDAEQDQLRRIDVAPPADLENRHSRWESQPTTWDFPKWLSSLLEVMFWLLIAVVLCYATYMMVRAFVAIESAAAVDSSHQASSAGDADRVESLPFQLKPAQTDLLQEAKRLYEAGRFGEAIVYLYSYQLLQLDKHHLIRLARGKTNRQYLREIRRHPAVRKLLENTMTTFEDVFFGNHTIGQARFESCWHGLDQFHTECGLGSGDWGVRS